ncbi:hypothetical protein WDJ50_02390 [Deinococcus sp. VB142]|uniref:Uncharacterized protein n=1 Tax=Deinococcus sp. VB142 TaxID=3112952 RepID=A0AAU6Q2Z9_9DEIO
MTKATPKTAADRDALIAAALNAGLDATRTAKDFFVAGERVTPAQLIALTDEARREAEARAEAFEAAEAIRAEVEMGEGDLEDQLDFEEPGPVAEVVVIGGKLAEVAAPADDSPVTPAKPARGVIKYGPPCGGDIAHLPIAISPEAQNPLVHLRVTATTTYKTKAEAAAAGKASGKAFLAFLAVDTNLETAWVVATVGDEGQLEIDGQTVAAELLTGTEAEVARAKLDGKRLKEKSQWRVQAA